MKKCKYCMSEIDNKAKVCPNCRKKQPSKTGLIIGIVLAVIIIYAVASGSEKEVTSKINEEKFSHTVENAYNDIFAYYIEGTVTNNLSKDYSYLQIEFVCYDAQGNNLGTAIDNTNNLLGNQTWKYKAMAIVSDINSIDHCDYHEITGW